jgi:hypothetical protein
MNLPPAVRPFRLSASGVALCSRITFGRDVQPKRWVQFYSERSPGTPVSTSNVAVSTALGIGRADHHSRAR